MKNFKWKVKFSNGNYQPQDVIVNALNADSAEILAKAIRINEGLDYTLYSIKWMK